MKFLLFIMLNVYNVLTLGLPIITLNRDNHVSLTETVDKDSIDKIMTDIHQLDQVNFYIYINSPGGYVEQGERFVSHLQYLQETGKNITCIAENAHSMAYYIFQNCNQRYIIPSSKVMQHQMTVYNNGQLTNIENYIEMITKISHRLNTFCAKRIGISLQRFNKLVSTDWWLYGQDIIDNNVADKMVLVGCNMTKEAIILKDGSLLEKKHPCPIINIVEKVTLTSGSSSISNLVW